MRPVEKFAILFIAATYVMVWMLALGAQDAIREIERGNADGKTKAIGQA